MTTLPTERPADATASANWDDVHDITEAVQQYLSGGMDEDAFRHFRVLRGLYSQRQTGVHMVRVRIPLGDLSACQMRRLAGLSREYGGGRVHLTTRQDVQLYHVRTADVPDVVRHLAMVGLTTRESGGSATRNVTVCPLAGVCPNQNRDVIPFAEAMGEHFLRSPLVQNLPRKFKVAFSGCERDCALAGISDAGFAANPDGKTFRMVIGGGLGSTPEVAHLLDASVPGHGVVPLTEATVRAFDRLGDRSNRAKARLKFVVRRLGMERLTEEIASERSIAAGPWPAVPDVPAAPATEPAVRPERRDDGFEAWRARAVVSQRQDGFFAVRVFVPCGDLSAEQTEALADAAERYGDGTARATVGQDVVLAWVPEANLPGLHRALAAAGLGEPYAQSVADVTVCPAAATCRLGVTRAADAADLVSEALKPLAADPDMKGASVKMAGCPNACGHHHLATIGLHGAAATIDGRQAPCYQILVGGGKGPEVAFGRRLAKVPARRVAEAVLRLIGIYREHREMDESPAAFFQRADRTWLSAQVADLTALSPRPGEDLFTDLGDTAPFRVDTGTGECAA